MTAHSLQRVRRSSDRNSWFIAWTLALLLHAAGILLVRDLAPIKPPSTPRRPEPVQLVFVGPKEPRPQGRRSEQPHVFTELPPDRADAAPKDAAFLSNVTSRARDLAPGGDDALPRMEGESDAPMVKLEPDGSPSRPSTATPPAPASATPQPTEPAVARADEPPQRAGATTPSLTSGQTGAGAGTPPATPSPPESPGTSAPAPAEAPRTSVGGGTSDIRQPEMDNPGGNAGLRGDVSLNTIAWNYAPWLQTFGRRLMRRWIPPPAYSLGILKEGGWAVIEVEISKSGKMLRLEVLEEQGHPSLSQAAQNALGSLTPIEPLPADFPEPTLILRVRMIYPKIRPRW